ncbi:MAG TPA: 23S rRNA (guanosine(2251)-2'-O)-methyltransferase RlmB, partial [Desulfurobacteriaceae bacterium]|nr:23S rRNA (guanosine(2251)-2'-O)-methyltransferase RlmB [Desulfurobacteriaceae bacterium]
MYIYGKNAILEALKDGKFISKVYVLKGKKEVLKDILKKLQKENIKIVESDKQKLKKLV